MDTSRGFGASKVNEDVLTSENVDIFKGWDEESSIVQGRNVCFRPISENVDGPFTFTLNPQGDDQYLQLNSIRLGALARVRIEDDTTRDLSDIGEKEDMSIVNMLPASLFKMITTEFNDVLVTDLTSPLAHYQTMIQTMLSYNKSAQKTHLQGQLFIPDEPGKHDVLTWNGSRVAMEDQMKTQRFGKDTHFSSVFNTKAHFEAIMEDSNRTMNKVKKRKATDWSGITSLDELVKRLKEAEEQEIGNSSGPPESKVVSGTSKEDVEEKARDAGEKIISNYVATMMSKKLVNKGYIDRRKIILKSKWFDFYIPIGIDICQSDRLLHPSVKMRLQFTRNTDSFCLLKNGPATRYKIDLKDLKLFGRYIRVSQDIVATHKRLHATKPLIYPVTRTVMKSYNVMSQQKAIHISNMFNGLLPKNIIITMVESSAFHGAINKNPYNFQHFNIESASLTVNGEKLPSEPINPDFDNDLFMREYVDFFRNIGIDVNQDSGNLVTPEHFKNGCFFMSFDLTGDQCNMLHRHKSQKGVIDFAALFREPLDQNITIIVHASLEAQIEIPKDQDPKVSFL